MTETGRNVKQLPNDTKQNTVRVQLRSSASTGVKEIWTGTGFRGVTEKVR